LHLQAIAGKDVKIEQMRSQIVAETSRVLDQQKDLTIIKENNLHLTIRVS